MRRNQTLAAVRELSAATDAVRRFWLQYGEGGVKQRVEAIFTGGVLTKVHELRTPLLADLASYTFSYGPQQISLPQGPLVTNLDAYTQARNWVNGLDLMRQHSLQLQGLVTRIIRKRASADPVPLLRRKAKRLYTAHRLAWQRIRVDNLDDGARLTLLTPYGTVTCKALWDARSERIVVTAPVGTGAAKRKSRGGARHAPCWVVLRRGTADPVASGTGLSDLVVAS